MKDVQEELAVQLARGQVIPFIGAGVSMSLKLPSYGSLIQELGGHIGFDGAIFEQLGDYLTLAEFYHLRKSGRARLVPMIDDLPLEADGVEDGDVRHDLDRLLSTVPARQRALVEDVKLSGYSLAEAGDRAGLSEGAARVSLHRAMKALMNRVTDRET